MKEFKPDPDFLRAFIYAKEEYFNKIEFPKEVAEILKTVSLIFYDLGYAYGKENLRDKLSELTHLKIDYDYELDEEEIIKDAIRKTELYKKTKEYLKQEE